MGNTVGAPIVSDYLEDEIGPIVSQQSIGNSRFLKTLKAIHDTEGPVIVKIYKKRLSKELLERYKVQLEEIKGAFENTHSLNLMPYQSFVETERSGYLIRQYFHNNLYDRLTSTRPFLSLIEKKFIAYQLLQSLNQAFFKGVCHGDIKCENVMVTTTNWIYLADFACYKPTHIPEDNPADFSFYFDTSGRRTCYIAPERFYESNKGPPVESELTNKMDIFSVGCVIAELFLEGHPIFDFSQMLSYRRGDYNPELIIRRIPDIHIQSLILHMIQREPDDRYSPERYITLWTEKAFPVYFPWVHQFISSLMRLEHDDRINCISDRLDEIIQIFTCRPKATPNTPLSWSTPSTPNIGPANQSNLKTSGTLQSDNNSTTTATTTTATTVSNTTTKTTQQLDNNNNNNNNVKQHQAVQNLSNMSNIILETNMFIKDCNNMSTTATSVSSTRAQQTDTTTTSGTIRDTMVSTSTSSTLTTQSSSFTNLPQLNVEDLAAAASTTATPKIVEGLDLLLAILYSALRHCQHPQTKLKCVGSLFVKIAQHLDDECRLQKIVPYIMSMISEDQPTLVRVEALRSLSKVLEMVQTFPPSDSLIFSQYILPSLTHVTEGASEEMDRIAFAQILPQLATTAKRFLEIAQHYRDSEGMERKDLQKYKVYDAELSELQDLFYSKVNDLLTKDSCNTVKRIILSDIYRLCVFFGRQKTNDLVLPLITTFLNSKDWQLRCAFFENIVAVCTVVGAGSLESFIYPMTLEALTDEEEFVTEKALTSLSELCELGLFRKAILLELLAKSTPLLLHPNTWIRYGVISLITKIAGKLSKTDFYCYVKPRVSQFLVADVSDIISEDNLLQLLISPISRESFNKMVNPNNRRDFPSSPPPQQFSEAPLSNKPLSNNNSSSGVGSNGRMKEIVNVINANKSVTYDSTDEYTLFLVELGIPDEDHPKIIKIFDYFLSKKLIYKSDDEKIIEKQNPPVVRVAKARSEPDAKSPAPGNLPSPVSTPVPPKSSGNSAAVVQESVVNPADLSVVTKKFTLNPRVYNTPSSTTANALTVEVNTELYIRPPPGMPDLGSFSEYGVMSQPQSLTQWRPSGILVSHFTEHRDAVNEIQVSNDNLFFATASNDGTVKIWDCLRMEKRVTNRARQTYTQEGRVTSISICEKSHTIASASDKGSIHIFKVEIGGKQKNENLKYSGLSTVRNLTELEGNIVSVDHYSTNSASIVTYATSKGGIHGWDLRSKQDAFLLNNELSLGLIQSFLIDPARNWFVTCTSRGFLTCWDLRFKIPLYSHRITNGRIFKMSPYFGTKFTSESWIFLASDSKDNVIVWDLASKQVTRIFRRSFAPELNQVVVDPSINLPMAQSQTSTSMSTSTNNNNPLSSSSMFSNTPGGPGVSTLSEYDFGIDNIRPTPNTPTSTRLNSPMGNSTSNLPYLSGANTLSDSTIGGSALDSSTILSSQQDSNANKKTPSVRAILSPPNCSYLITAGDDKRIKYWDWDNPNQSYYVSQGKEAPMPHSHKVSFIAQQGTQINEEIWDANPSATYATYGQSPSSRSKQKVPLMPTIHHQETIMDLKVMEVPQPMLISASADGIVKIWK
ncbi:hypothetical protein SAMD00019534_105580 [Acytostelium subglobosum LB1]|uniref:hypothetical protein n=1 Tax=Acytostelium subglobosum LB1 TaxID=1410327 RepID=UPI00064522A8|nr:hypothetical protein SAMD00019534_105580 [Acytostelium subglobosum LB1]GAM27383.1 hypothetical protein SAMD00019534_105580 [Acytostelium subglobosum LB1]|eukprot:XP_012749850.1 hypothetical protein SAMD00019534_105580 [Acytostelium subglobosum LB1]